GQEEQGLQDLRLASHGVVGELPRNLRPWSSQGAMTSDQVNHETTGEPLTPEQAVARLEDLQRLSDAALAFLNLEELLNELLDRVKEILRVDTAAVLLVED